MIAVHLLNVLVMFIDVLTHEKDMIKVSGTSLAAVITNDCAYSSPSARMMPVDDGRQPSGVSSLVKQVRQYH